ncbi:hypothetical protein GGE45_002108 [Rhizobium aethiopicum]|uniref:Uncharacterized protein n=1 Tax=Rhizobium aethiopicum TaxID=1138170 RepID=A0A7W6QA08_9HYPH|nr:hypothetical protein [Rhizobium aethiopicum]MBB4192542.1 hypothetical protein [Rhizobium aethiopicum]MBB4579782.1 hypothetical protein [Rhizobium aethiopicum]
MRRILLSLILCLQSASMLAASGAFHTTAFDDSRLVSLSLTEGGPAHDRAFDFDVVITLSEIDRDGAVLYQDGGRHEASVRCVSPAMVRVNSAEYVVDVSARPGTDWKHDLWATLCTAPAS